MKSRSNGRNRRDKKAGKCNNANNKSNHSHCWNGARAPLPPYDLWIHSPQKRSRKEAKKHLLHFLFNNSSTSWRSHDLQLLGYRIKMATFFFFFFRLFELTALISLFSVCLLCVCVCVERAVLCSFFLPSLFLCLTFFAVQTGSWFGVKCLSFVPIPQPIPVQIPN